MRPISAQFCTPDSVIGRLIAVCVLALLGAPSVGAQARQELRIVPIVRSDQVHITFDLKDGFTRDVRDVIHSGLRTTFTYSVDLRLDVPVGWDRTIASSVVTSSVDYDNLTRKYLLERRIDGRVEDARETDREDDVREWLTNMKDLGLFRTSLLEPNREYYVRVNATARPSQGVIFWPFGNGISGQAKFTFIR